MTTIRKSKKSATTTSNTATSSATTTTTTASTTSVLVPLPPSIAAFPSAPEGYTPTARTAYRGVLPKSAQLAVMPGVVDELQRFDDYLEVFGKTAPPLAAVTQTFQAATQWSAMRIKAQAWVAYALSQEGMAWRDLHAFMDRMQPAFDLAVQGDATVGTNNPMLVRLFGAPKLIAQKAAATKKANDKLRAEGKLPLKGAVGKRRKRAAANAALAEQQASTPSTAEAPAAATPATNAGGTTPAAH